MLSRVKIQNFKSIGEPGVDLELKPLTFLVGPNGGGKSSILEAIVVQAQNGTYSGRLMNFPSWEDLTHKPQRSDMTIDIFFDNDEISNVLSGHRLSINRNLQPTQVPLDELGQPTSSNRAIALVNRLVNDFRPKTFLISSIRGNVPYHVDTGANPNWVGTHGEFLTMLLSIIFGSREYKPVENQVVRWAKRFGVEGLEAGVRGSNTAGSDYLDSELKVALNLALSSSGAKQILTIITQLFWAAKGSLLMIEEPEISLHPQAQIDVLEMFSEAIKENDKQIIATTHGLFMIQAIGYAVQKGWLEREQIAVYHIEKKKDTGTIAKQLPLNDRGYIKGWIPSFTRVERKLLKEWTDTLPEA